MSDDVLRYGKTNDHVTSWALRNFPAAKFNPLTFCCTPVELLSNDGKDGVCGWGSGFFWKFNEEAYLITNWHVVSQKDFFTRECINCNAYVPLRLRIRGLQIHTENGFVRIDRPTITMDLDEENHRKLFASPWRINDTEVDIVAIPCRSEYVVRKNSDRRLFKGSESLTCFANESAESKIATGVGDDCFVLGYPLQNYEGLMPPVWKRGTIASETQMGVAGRPAFLVDASVGSGMSGSPIIRKITTFVSHDAATGVIEEHSAYAVIGVYAGRLKSNNDLRANIGYGWYEVLIDELLTESKHTWSQRP